MSSFDKLVSLSLSAVAVGGRPRMLDRKEKGMGAGEKILYKFSRRGGVCVGLRIERSLLMLKKGNWVDGLVGWVVRIIEGAGEVVGRLKADGDKRWGEAKRVT